MIGNNDAALATGEAKFAGEALAGQSLAYVYPVVSPVAKGRLLGVDFSPLDGMEGVLGRYVAADVPGKNWIGATTRAEEPLVAVDEVKYVGQPVGFVVADSWGGARAAAAAAKVLCEEEEPILTIDEAIAAGSYYSDPMVVSCGDLEGGFASSCKVIEGSFESGAQEHAYLETNRAYALPGDHGLGIKILCATQAVTDVQGVVALVLGLADNDVEVDVLRVGGAFGGKERGCTMWSAFSALGCVLLGRACAAVLDRRDDLSWTGKRHPFKTRYRVGFDEAGRILAFDVDLAANGGYFEDFTVAIMERAMLGIDGPYYLPAARITGRSCRTNLPANTAFRGFGAPQATLAMETILARVARESGRPLPEVQRANFYAEGQETPYGQVVREVSSPALMDRVFARADYPRLAAEVEAFNARSRYRKRGLGFVPIKYGIGFTATFLNQGNALVYVYQDGSVSVSHGGIEMGQGLYAKVQKIVALTLGVSVERVKCESTNTKRVGSVASTAASTGSDLNGYAAREAALKIRSSLAAAASELLGGESGTVPDPSTIVFADDQWWDPERPDAKRGFAELAGYCYFSRRNLGAQGHYATPGLVYDMEAGVGNPFSYFTTGNCLALVELDLLSGRTSLLEVHICHEGGHPIDAGIDRGQIVGGFMQGFGYVTMEELRTDERGRPLVRGFSTYKVPACDDFPGILDVDLVESDNECASVLGSKGVGEPPLLYGAAVFMAIRDALESSAGRSVPCELGHPATPERVVMEAERMKLAAPR